MNIIKTLLYMGYDYPDFEIADDLDGNGQYIQTWNHVDVEPDNATLATNETAMLAAEAAAVLPNAKIAAKAEVDKIAGDVRAKYTTITNMQQMVYQDKTEEATDYVAAAYPVDLTSYPYIQAEVNATGKTSTQAADDILAAKSAWVAKGSAIEEQRLLGKGNIDLAADEAAVTTAKDNAIAALELI